MKRCPYCAEEIQDQAILCRFCNRELVPAAALPPLLDITAVPPSRPVKRKPLMIVPLGFVLTFISRDLSGLGILIMWIGFGLGLPSASRIIRWGGGLLAAIALASPALNLHGPLNEGVVPARPSAQAPHAGTPNPSATTSGSSGVTLANYMRLREGMSYREAVGLLGEPGTEISRASMAGTTTVMYQWYGSGLARLSGGNMNAMFQDGQLVTKAQFGLR